MEHYRIYPGSSGSFLCPPGHPSHRWEVRGATSYAKLDTDPNYIGSLDHVASDESMPAGIRKSAQKRLDEAQLVCSELWQRYVYSYFRNCYSPDGVDRNVQRIIDSGPPEHHLGYLMVKQYFPEAQPRLDLIADSTGGYGTAACTKCGKRLQYEGKVDAFAEAITARLVCPNGGHHTTN